MYSYTLSLTSALDERCGGHPPVYPRLTAALPTALEAVWDLGSVWMDATNLVPLPGFESRTVHSSGLSRPTDHILDKVVADYPVAYSET